MAEESEAQAERDVTAATEGYGGPVSDEELADVYLPDGQDQVQDTGSGQAAAGAPDAPTEDEAPDGSGTADGSPAESTVEPPD